MTLTRKTQLKRTPMPRKRATKRTTKTPGCSKQRCSRRVIGAGLCRTHLIAECDRMARDEARETYPKCQRCGSTKDLQWSHLLSRRFMAIRWDSINFVMHCAACHKYLTEHPAIMAEWVQNYVGESMYRWLMDRAYGARDPHTGTRSGAPQFKDSDLVAWYERLGGEK